MDRHKAGVIILGHPRSGTTLLRRLLDGHSRIACPPETHILSSCARFLDSEMTSQGVDMGVLSGLSFAGFSDEETLTELRQFAFSYLERYSEKLGKSRWAEKTAFDAFHIEAIDQLCGGHALYICVVRHPLDVAISTKEFCDSMGTYPGVLHEHIREHPQPVVAFSSSWLEVACQIEELQDRRANQCIIVRYEDLVTSTESTLRRLMAFIGEDYEPEMVERGLARPNQFGFGDHKAYSNTSVHSDSTDRWQLLPDFQVAKLATQLNPILSRFQYPELVPAVAVDPVSARERYSRNLELLSRRSPESPQNSLNASHPETTVTYRPFSVYNLKDQSRNDASFSLSRSLDENIASGLLKNGASPVAKLSAALLALLRRVSENEELFVGVLDGASSTAGTALAATVKVTDTEGMSIGGFLEAVKSVLRTRGTEVADKDLSEEDFLVTTLHEGDSLSAGIRKTSRAFSLGYSEEKPSSKLTFEFNQGVWSEAQALRFTEHFIITLRVLLQAPDALVDDISLLTPTEESILFPERQATPVQLPQTDESFFLHVKEHPDKVAAVYEQESLTYRQLGQRVHALAGLLRSKGIDSESIVAVCLHRSLDLVTSLLAVMHAGATYVPLDPDYPASRIDQIIEDANPKLVLTEGTLEETLQASGALQVVNLSDINWQSHQFEQDDIGIRSDLAYVIFTSGSTGRPKGVQVKHRSLSAFLYAMSKEPGLTENDRLLSVTTVSFDIAALELFLPLTTGATLYIASRKDTVNGIALKNLLLQHRISVLQATPATYHLLLKSDWEGFASIKLLCGGEALPAELASQLLDRCSELWNMYGPTETTIWSTVKRIRRAENPMSIGRPIIGTSTYILNEGKVPVPVNVPGELYIGGEGVAQGYIGRPELTAERFVEDPFADDSRARMYRTGDLVRTSEEGDLFYLGRLDRQVKIRGYRIELGEIEVALSELESVRRCVAESYTSPGGSKQLVAYLIPENPDMPVGINHVKEHLSSRVPEYMIPVAAVSLEAFPLTPNNKIDHKALPAPSQEHYSDSSSSDRTHENNTKLPPVGSEQIIVRCLEKYFGRGKVTEDSTFVSLGGDSLTYVQVTMDLEDILGTVPDGWESLSVSSLAQTEVQAETVFVELDNTTLIRAVAIIFIVFNHAVLFASSPQLGIAGWTSGLFMVAGFLLAKFQFPATVSNNNSMPIISSVIRIVIPATLFTAAFQLYNGQFQPDVLLLYSNLVRHTGPYWFIQVLVQILAFMSLMLSIGPVRRFAAGRPFDFGLVLLAIGGAALLSVPFDRIPDARNFQMPHLMFWMFAMGWCIQFCDTRQRRVSIAYALCAFGALGFILEDYVIFGVDFSVSYFVITVALGLILLLFPKIPLIRPMQYLVYPLAGASLFVLLTHMEVMLAIDKLGYGNAITLNLVSSLLVGYLAWRAWEFISRQFDRKRQEEPI